MAQIKMDKHQMFFDYEVNYFWYHHMTFSFGEEALIHKAIQDGDFPTFKLYYLEYGSEYFPPTASIFAGGNIIGEIEIYSPEGFALITHNECECG